MRKRNKVITTILAIIMVFPLFLGLGSKVVMGEESPVLDGLQRVRLHKVHMPNMPEEEDFTPNTGDLMDDFGGTPLEGAVFTAYDVTAEYWAAYAKSEGTNDAMKSKDASTAVLGLKDTVTGGIVFDATNINGVSTKDLPVKSGGRSAIYLFIETESPAGVVQGASVPFVLGLPIYNENSDIQKEIVHIYPKNEFKTVNLEFTKYGVIEGEQPAVLQGAKFILKGTNGKYYNTSSNAFDLEEAAALEQEEQLTSAADGTVSVSDLVLAEGEYKFYEIDSEVSTSGSQATDADDLYHYDSSKNPVVIAHVSKNMTITYDYYELNTEKQLGSETAKVYNYQVPKPQKVADDHDVDVDQEIVFEISQLIPTDINNYTAFSLVDEFHEDLTLVNNDETKLLEEIQTSMTTLSELVTGVTIDGNKFTVAFDLAEVKKNAGETITFKVSMAVKSGAALDTDIENKVTFDNNYGPKTATDAVKTYGKQFLKIDMETEEALAGAKFYVKKGDFYLGNDENGKQAWALPTGQENGQYTFDEGFIVKELTSEDNGYFAVSGLARADKEGDITYRLEEFVAPDGYALLKGNIDFIVDDGEEALPVANKHKGSLPSTGGTGIVAFVLIGVVAVGGAVLYFTKGRRQIEG